jgi:hypothetical protein
MTMYYQVLFDDEGVYGVAYTDKNQETGPCFPPPGGFGLPYAGIVEDWQPLALELREGDFADYLASNLGCRLCSDRLKSILESHASPADELQWLVTEVHRRAEKHVYWILHFPNPPDVLNKSKTLFVDGTDVVVKPVLSKDATAGHQVFAYPEAGELTLFVGEPVKRAIEAAGCTGMELSRAPLQ